MNAGRQREFDKKQALEQAMYVFWKNGYVGASLSDLTSQMGINKPSMYSAFGNKEMLFIDAVDLYLEKYAKPHIKYLHEKGTALNQRVLNYLCSIVATQCDLSKPSGCFISMTASEAAGESIPEQAKLKIAEAYNYSEDYLTKFFIAELDSPSLSLEFTAQELAVYCLTLLHGTAAQARTGKPKEQLVKVMELALKRVFQ